MQSTNLGDDRQGVGAVQRLQVSLLDSEGDHALLNRAPGIQEDTVHRLGLPDPARASYLCACEWRTATADSYSSATHARTKLHITPSQPNDERVALPSQTFKTGAKFIKGSRSARQPMSTQQACLCARFKAWASSAAEGQGSSIYTTFAAVSVRPAAALPIDSKNTCRERGPVSFS